MGYTSDGADIECKLDIPIIVVGDELGHGGGKSGGPFCSAASPVAREALAKSGALLDALHPALREGYLEPSGLRGLESLQRFYLALKRQLDGHHG
jgi:hypothetical protein